MSNEKLYLFSELDPTARKNAKALVQEQRFYLAYLAEKLDRDFVEPFIVENLSPQYDDFFEYCLWAAPDGTVGFGHLHVNATRKEDINFLLEFLLQSDYRSGRHSISKIHIDYECLEEPKVIIDIKEPFRGRKNTYTREALENFFKVWIPALGAIISGSTTEFVEFVNREQDWLVVYIEDMEFKFTKDGKHIII